MMDKRSTRSKYYITKKNSGTCQFNVPVCKFGRNKTFKTYCMRPFKDVEI